MSESKHIHNAIRNSSNKNNPHNNELVPPKVIGVNSIQKPNTHNQSEEHQYQKSSKAQTGSTQQKPKKHFENAFDAVSELEETYGEKTTGNKKSVLECIAKHNLKNQCPTQKEILKDLKNRTLSEENLKKLLQRLRKSGLVLTYPEKLRNEYQYVLAHMQHIVKADNKAAKTNGTVKETEKEEAKEEIETENGIQNFFVQILKNKPNPEFHNITLESQLSDNGDYYNICNWPMPSKKNKAKILEKRISRHRSFKITLYPNGTTIINVAASQQPFDWYCREGWIDFIGICGEILNEIKNVLSNPEPLKSKIYDWRVTQVDVGFDIPLSTPRQKINSPSKGSFSSPNPFNGCLKVKHLDRVYQIYDKQLPNKGSCLRIEEQVSFTSTPSSFQSPVKKKDYRKSAMTVHELRKSFQYASVEEIIKTVFSIDICSHPSCHSSTSNQCK